MKEHIRKVLKEYNDRQKKLLSFASQIGFLETAKLAGGIQQLLQILGEDFLTKNNKIKIINEVVLSNGITEYDRYITFYAMDQDPIIVNDEDGKLSQIEILYPEEVLIVYYGGYQYSQDLGDKYEFYESLSDDIIDDIFNMVITYAQENGLV